VFLLATSSHQVVACCVKVRSIATREERAMVGVWCMVVNAGRQRAAYDLSE